MKCAALETKKASESSTLIGARQEAKEKLCASETEKGVIQRKLHSLKNRHHHYKDLARNYLHYLSFMA